MIHPYKFKPAEVYTAIQLLTIKGGRFTAAVAQIIIHKQSHSFANVNKTLPFPEGFFNIFVSQSLTRLKMCPRLDLYRTNLLKIWI